MTSPRNQIIALIEQGGIAPDNIPDALTASRVEPDGESWKTFLDHLLLWLGGLALAFAVMFFIAYNWDDLGRFAKFGLMEGLIIMTVLVYWKLDKAKVAAKISLLLASIFLGVLLALYGQTYQTGADPWQLFFTWALLMLPWAMIGRFSAIWILWIGLINTSIILYHMTFRNAFWMVFDSDMSMLWWVFIFNTLALFAWEFLEQRWTWLAERWATRLLALASGTAITWLAIYVIFDPRQGDAVSIVVWLAWMGGLYFFYRMKKPDLFMLAGGCLSGIVVIVSVLIRYMLDRLEAGGFLLLALVIIGLGTGAAIWLRNVHREWTA
ncbi:MAG: DUF2157 domain-containing protein [Gammaproteobacteria bacterium]|nr:DUF2157 domain-containing protein [Gammaproteobacteria bacterium]